MKWTRGVLSKMSEEELISELVMAAKGLGQVNEQFPDGQVDYTKGSATQQMAVAEVKVLSGELKRRLRFLRNCGPAALNF